MDSKYPCFTGCLIFLISFLTVYLLYFLNKLKVFLLLCFKSSTIFNWIIALFEGNDWEIKGNDGDGVMGGEREGWGEMEEEGWEGCEGGDEKGELGILGVFEGGWTGLRGS